MGLVARFPAPLKQWVQPDILDCTHPTGPQPYDDPYDANASSLLRGSATRTSGSSR